MVHKLIIEAIDTANREHLHAEGIKTLADHALDVVEVKYSGKVCTITLSADNDHKLTGKQTYEYDRFDLSAYDGTEIEIAEENEESIRRAFLTKVSKVTGDVLGTMEFEDGVAIISAKEDNMFWYGQVEILYSIQDIADKPTVEDEYPNTIVEIEEP